MLDQLKELLNRAKKAKRLTVTQMAEQSGISKATLDKIMSGDAYYIKRDKLERLAAVLDIPMEVLLPLLGKSSPTADSYLGMVKIACISPELKVADCPFNAAEIIRRVRTAERHGVKIALFPELCITGYTCGDLFFQQTLRASALAELQRIRDELRLVNVVTVVGLPLADACGRLYNVAAVVYGGEILGVVPKRNLPNYNEFMEKRYFCTYEGDNTTLSLFGRDVPFGNRLIFADSLYPEVRFGVEICEDVWVTDSPSASHAAAGANAVLNLSSSNETIVKAPYRRKMIEIQSAKCGIIYAYCSSGMSESTSTTVFSAHNIICENGELIAESEPFGNGYAEVAADFGFIQNERARLDRANQPSGYTYINYIQCLDGDMRLYSRHPFLPFDPNERNEVCERAMTILAYGLKKRVEHIRAKKLLLGLSGGSDSALALMVCARTMKLLDRPLTDIVAVTMPCFGTARRTLDNATELAEAVGVTLMKIDITDSVRQHLHDIGHDESVHDTVYENAQARERTQVLMDLANQMDGLVIGTGDMSEAALGWSTFNGDQMSMYAVIASVPKTLVYGMLEHCTVRQRERLRHAITNVINTPASPELLPPDEEGNISQITEEHVGPYELHDYFLFMILRKGFSPRKVYALACKSFEGVYEPDAINKWLRFFLQRFFSQQFKRSCSPDSVRLGSVDLGKYALRLPSDAEVKVWLDELDRKEA